MWLWPSIFSAGFMGTGQGQGLGDPGTGMMERCELSQDSAAASIPLPLVLFGQILAQWFLGQAAKTAGWIPAFDFLTGIQEKALQAAPQRTGCSICDGWADG